MRRLVGGVIGSRCRSTIAALPVAGVVKLTAAAALDEVSVTRWPAGCRETRMMSTTAVGGEMDYDNDDEVPLTPAEYYKLHMTMLRDPPKVTPRVAVRVEDIIIVSWESLQKKLIDVPALRTEEEMSAIFERWSAHYNKTYATAAQKKRRFEVFRKKFRHIDCHNANLCRYSKSLVRLDAHCDRTTWEYLMDAKNGKFQ